MDSDVAHPKLGKWSWALLWLTVGVIVGGSLVRATGSGDGCGESWPRCEGSLFPLGGGTETTIEFAHRLATLGRADDVMILESGSVIEYGDRERLASDPSSSFYRLLRAGLEEVLA